MIENITPQQAAAILNPPVAPLSEAQHQAAKARFVYDIFMWEMLFDMALYIKIRHNEPMEQFWKDQGEEYIANRALEAARAFDAISEGKGDDWWDHVDTESHFERWVRPALEQPHLGDCTAHPASCSRCHAEAYYGLKSSVWWNKHQGNQLFELAQQAEK